jgi:hypothetical protein
MLDPDPCIIMNTDPHSSLAWCYVCVPEAGHDMAGGTEGASQLGRRNRLPQRVLYPYVQHGRLVGRAENNSKDLLT